jgi:hypothetical protein
MSKGKRKSDPEALNAVYARLRARGLAISPDAPVFSAADRELLLKLCRLDLIHVIEVELQLGPLKSSQKNSVGGMVHWLLHQRWVWGGVFWAARREGGAGATLAVGGAPRSTTLRPLLCVFGIAGTDNQRRQHRQRSSSWSRWTPRTLMPLVLMSMPTTTHRRVQAPLLASGHR